MKEVILRINNINDNSSAQKLEKHLCKQKNIYSAKVLLKDKLIKISYKNLTIEEIEKLIEENGYQSLGVELTNITKKESLNSLFFLGILLLITVYIFLSSSFNLPLLIIFNTKTKIIGISVITIIFLLYSKRIWQEGIKKINGFKSFLMLIILINIIYSIWNTYNYFILNNKKYNFIYLIIVLFIIYIERISQIIESKNNEEINETIKELERTNISKAKIIENDKYKEINFEEIKENDKVICFPGDRILLDGIVTKDKSHFDETLLSGKSNPIAKKQNDVILSGSMNYENQLEYTVKNTFSSSYRSKLKRRIVDELNKRKDKKDYQDRTGSILIILSIIGGIITGFINYMVNKNIEEAISRAIISISILCPLGIILSTSLGFNKISSNARKKGILVKKINSLEILRKINTVVIDKTSTLTYGYLTINKISNHSDMSDKELLELLGSIEKHSTHAIARGITKYLRIEKIKAKYDFTTEDLLDYGVKAIDDENIYYACGSNLLKKLEINNPYTDEEKMKQDNTYVIHLVKNKKVIATFGLKDTLRKESKKLINYLEEKKLDIIMLTGDDDTESIKIAKELGINKVYSNKSEVEKQQIIKDLKKKGKRVMMIGDGNNDSLAFIESDIGITLKNHSDIPAKAADIIVTNKNLLKVTEIFNIRKATLKLIRQNKNISLLFGMIIWVLNLGVIPHIKLSEYIIILSMIFNVLLVVINNTRTKIN